MEIEVGQLVCSTAGRDRQGIFLVCGVEEPWVYLVDGKYRPVARPKKKNWRHVRPLAGFDPQLAQAVKEGQPLSDHQIRRTIAQLTETLATHLKQGGCGENG